MDQKKLLALMENPEAREILEKAMLVAEVTAEGSKREKTVQGIVDSVRQRMFEHIQGNAEAQEILTQGLTVRLTFKDGMPEAEAVGGKKSNGNGKAERQSGGRGWAKLAKELGLERGVDSAHRVVKNQNPEAHQKKHEQDGTTCNYGA